ncbi:MAG: uridine phosphorylase [Proteobacteria bacterium]|nr:uridine phosphorylase [Pseudomonadota bacterium]
MFVAQHLPIEAKHTKGNGQYGRLFFLPGSDGRARRISERFEGLEVINNDRQHNVYLGHVKVGDRQVDLGTVSTGMGCASLNIIVSELIMLGGRQFMRVGTAGSLLPETLRAGSLVIATGAVRDEGVSNRYVVSGYPAIGSLQLVEALEKAAMDMGLGERTFSGVVHTKESLYAVEFGHGPLKHQNHQYMAQLHGMRVLASDMETSHLFVLSDVHSNGVAPISQTVIPEKTIRSGAILAVIGDDAPYGSADVAKKTEDTAIDVAISAATDARLWA